MTRTATFPATAPSLSALCRELSTDAAWKRILTDPDMSHVLNVQHEHLPPVGHDREYIEARDQHCRLPGCRRPAHESDIDHTIEFDLHGRTVRVNLFALCLKHHKLKHLKDWILIQDPDGFGTLTCITPTGQMYRTRPPTPLGAEVPPECLTPFMPEPAPQPFLHAV